MPEKQFEAVKGRGKSDIEIRCLNIPYINKQINEDIHYYCTCNSK